jgi:hypothetical protein
MKRTTLTAAAAAGLMTAALATPAWSQATTYPDGTDCSAISDSASQTECMQQMNESRQNPAPGSVVPDADGTGNIQPGAPDAPDNNANAPTTNSGTGNNTDTPGGGTQNQPSSPDSNVGGSGVGN